MKKIVIRVLIILYIIIAIFITGSLLTYNKLHISEINNKAYVKLSNDVGKYKKGSLLVINKSDEYDALDNVFYCKLKKEKCVVSYGKITTVMSGSPTIDNQNVNSNLIIGKDVNVRSYPLIGSIMNVLESRWGYLFVVVVPILCGFIFQLRNVMKESKK